MFEWLVELPLFSNFLIPLTDVLVLAFLLFKGYEILVQTRAVQIIRGAALLFVLYGVAFVLNLRTLLTVLNLMVPGLVIAISIIFQPELRKIFTKIGQGRLLRSKTLTVSSGVETIIQALCLLGEKKRGALVVFVQSVGLKSLTDTGVPLDAEISVPLLLSIFEYDSALHDGAVIVENGRLAAANTVLSLTTRADLQNNFGTRHRAAIGVVEETDAIAVVLSEETSSLSLAYDGILYYNLPREELTQKLYRLLGVKDQGPGEGENDGALDEI